MIVVASANGDVGMGAAVAVLRAGGSALDAVEAGCRVVESNRDDHTVGIGGYPNLLGEVELDASLMEGTTRRAGAVAALKGFPHPISIARAVMEHLPQHVLLVGEGAARFAAEAGFVAAELRTPETEAAWRRKVADSSADQSLIARVKAAAQNPEKTVGTVNFLAQDADGRVASAVSTSGWAFTYPGRVGDSPLIGAGNYCDDRWGACACTGLGELAIRSGTAHTVVLLLREGYSLEAACERAFHDLYELPLPYQMESEMNFIALHRDGSHAGYATHKGVEYVWQTTEMAEYATEARRVLSSHR